MEIGSLGLEAKNLDNPDKLGELVSMCVQKNGTRMHHSITLPWIRRFIFTTWITFMSGQAHTHTHTHTRTPTCFCLDDHNYTAYSEKILENACVFCERESENVLHIFM